MEDNLIATEMDRGFRIAQGYLRQDLPEPCKYAVNYAIRINVPSQPGCQKKIINVCIKSTEGKVFGNGTYILEDGGRPLLKLVRTGANWHAVT